MPKDEQSDELEALLRSMHDLHHVQMRSAWKLRPEKSQVALEVIGRGGAPVHNGPLPVDAGCGLQPCTTQAARQADGIAVSDLAHALHSSMPATSRLLGTLEKRGLITRRQDPVDRRKTRVTLTDAGERERARGRDLLQEFASLIADDFGAERLGAFAAEAGQLAGAMQRALAVMEKRHPELTGGNPPFPPHPPFRDMDARCGERRE